MSTYWNSRVQHLKPYVPGEQPRDKTYIKLNTNESPYPPSPATLAAFQTAASGSLRLYPDPTALELRQALADHYRTTPERVFVGNGSDEILAFVFAAFFENRSNPAVMPVLFPDISYSFYPVYADLWDIPYQCPPLADDFSLRVDDYLVPNGGVIFPNPNAPTGLALPLSDVLRIAAYQQQAGKVLVVDEAYVDFGGESAAAAVKEYPNLLVVHTLSKSRSLAGLRVGFALGQDHLIEGLGRIKDSFNSYTLDRGALAGATAAIKDTTYYEETARRIIATRTKTVAALRELGFIGPESQANFIFMGHPALSGEALFKSLRDKGILVRWFNKPRINHLVRISIGSDAEMDELVAACQSLVQ